MKNMPGKDCSLFLVVLWDNTSGQQAVARDKHAMAPLACQISFLVLDVLSSESC